MAKTEDALRAEVPGVYRLYCDQVWDEALNRAEVKISSALREAENIYYLEAIRPSSSGSSKLGTTLEVAHPEKNISEKAFPSSGNPPKVSKQPGANGKKAEVTKGVPVDANEPSAAPEDPTKDDESPRMELVLAMLLIPAKGDTKGTDQGSSEIAAQQPKAPPHGKIVIKKK